MPVTKRTRYEVLRRDNHTCRYCGAKAPDVTLTIDHVVPVALGGGDDPENLVAACRDCNYGKSSAAPDAALVADVEQDALRWARAWRSAVEEMMLARSARGSYIRAFLNAWQGFDPNLRSLPEDFEGMLNYWQRTGVPVEVITDATYIAMGKRYVAMGAKFRYVIGIVKNEIAAIETRTRELVDAEGGDPDGT